jgi:hypothetical protein
MKKKTKPLLLQQTTVTIAKPPRNVIWTVLKVARYVLSDFKVQELKTFTKVEDFTNAVLSSLSTRNPVPSLSWALEQVAPVSAMDRRGRAVDGGPWRSQRRGEDEGSCGRGGARCRFSQGVVHPVRSGEAMLPLLPPLVWRPCEESDNNSGRLVEFRKKRGRVQMNRRTKRREKM